MELQVNVEVWLYLTRWKMNNIYSIFPIKSISPFSFMAAKRNYFHQEFCILFHFIQLYESDSEGWPTYFISTFSPTNVGWHPTWHQCHWAGKDRAPGPGSRWQVSSSSLAGDSLLLKCRNKVQTSHTSKHSNQMTQPSFEKREGLNGPISKRLLSL